MIKRIALLSLLSCLLAACGNKGPLVLPDKPDAATPATPATPATQPAPAADAQPNPSP
ncbi:MAG: lipoprotein [Thermomonas sp.]|uniref:LPS translocon maturation chaperone LptM n=1 Tax=Thermomonas sp. TaxID=1971895 RepID=UPI001D343D75|nr:lipoprotein [Thermomonas sp.]MBZ0087154.1 lipoprotein [Thermomonas sp.]